MGLFDAAASQPANVFLDGCLAEAMLFWERRPDPVPCQPLVLLASRPQVSPTPKKVKWKKEQ